MSQAIAAADAAGRLVTVEEHHQLAINGLTPEPLPPGLVTAGRHLLDLTAVRDNKNDLEINEAEYQRREAS